MARRAAKVIDTLCNITHFAVTLAWHLHDPHRHALQPLGRRREKGTSLFEKRDSPLREMGQPFSEKGIGVFGSVHSGFLLGGIGYICFISKGKDSAARDIKKAPLCNGKVHRGVLKSTKSVRGRCTRGYSNAACHFSFTKYRRRWAAPSTAWSCNINNTEGVNNLVSLW